MQGTIQTRHLISCALIIIQEFGFRAYLKCWWWAITRRNITFLECVCKLRSK
jgi:hypothetical protein